MCNSNRNMSVHAQDGIVFVEMMVALVIISALLAIAIPNVSVVSKRIATKHEMSNVTLALQLYEVDNGALPSSLSSLAPNYFAAASGYDKDQFGVNYTWTVGTRTLCSTSFSPSYCVVVP